MYTIIYNSNPNHPKHLNHIGAFSQLTEQDSKEFDTLDQAITFWFDCNNPITKLIDFKDEMAKKYKEFSEEQIEEILSISEIKEEDITKEEYLLNQNSLYNYQGE